MQISELSLEETEMVNGAGIADICDFPPDYIDPCDTSEFMMEDTGLECP
jgi:hypothetical protein